jgi:tartrate-resistant acid phosphatase type 5
VADNQSVEEACRMKRVTRAPLVIGISLLAMAACSPATVPAVAVAPPDVTCEAPVMPPTVTGPSGASLQIAALGDGGEGPEERGSHLSQTIGAVRKLGTVDAVLLLGDNIYPCGARGPADRDWQRVIAPLFAIGRSIYPILGNHDWGRKAISDCAFSSPEAQIAQTGRPGFELWQFPAPTYVVTTGVAEFILFDSSPIAYSWVEERKDPLCALRAALARPKSTPWRVVVGHHPLYSCGDHGDDQSAMAMRAALDELLAASGVDLYLAGHDHDLEIASRPGLPVHVVSGSASRIRRRGATCREGDHFRITGGFALLDISPADFTVRMYCNGTGEPCMERRIERTRP